MMTLQKREHPAYYMNFLGPVLALLMTLVVGGVLFYLMGFNPIKTLSAFFISPMSDKMGLTELLVKASPIILCALGLSFCFRANQWNIGAEGQLLCGAMASGAMALNLSNIQGSWVIYLVLLTGVLAGILWAAIPALLKVHFKTNEILTSLMLTYVAFQLLQYLVYGPLKDPNGYGFPQSELFSAATTITPLVEGSRLHKGVLVAPLLALVVFVIFNKHILGYRIRLIGLAPAAAKYAGFSQKKIVWTVFLISGACAGLAGALEVTGIMGQLVPTVSPGYGFTAIIVAFLGRLNPIGIIFAGLAIALTYLGGEALQIADINQLRLESVTLVYSIPQAIGDVFQGAILFFLLMTEVLITHKIVWKKRGSVQ
ncbi:MAG: sugar ABC transporter permease [Gammaproteobacteria bacterium]|nr:MAG: sugar ABC transporter permease [Gammaproteobacteria bacterium]